MALKIEAGKTYRRRDGSVDTIRCGVVGSEWPFESYKRSYRVDGTEDECHGEESRFDLIEEVAQESEYAEWIGRDVPDGIDADNPPREVEVNSSAGWQDRGSTSGLALFMGSDYRIKRSLIPAQPKPGEWWECSFADSSQVALLVGKNADGDNVWETRSHGVLANVEPVRHLPDCTGFDYEIPVAKDEPNAIPFAGESWYRLQGGKCVELDGDRFCSVGCGLIANGGRDLKWLWDLDGTIGGVTPANEPSESWYLAEKLDGPPPALPERFEHLHPAEFRLPKKGERFLCKYWPYDVNPANVDFTENRRWIVRKIEKPATKKITLRRWLHKHGDQWHLTLWQEQPPRMASGEPVEYGKSKIVEVPDAP